MDNLKQYIYSTFNYGIDVDAVQYSQNSKLKLLDKKTYYIYPVPITYNNLKEKYDEYKKLIIKATQTWSNALNNRIKFEVIDSLYGADIKLYWTKESRTKAGMQYVEQNGNLLSNLCVTIGLMDVNGNNYTSEEVYKIILHEFGHVLGLGHSPDINDVMSPEWGHANKLSYNDILVLNLIYQLGTKSYAECENYIETYLSQNLKPDSNIPNYERDILCETQNIGSINKFRLSLQNINIKYPKP